MPPLSRVRWVEGSRLTRRDLADAIEHEARMLALHVVSMHRTWGVAVGLRATIGSDLRSVRLAAGSAYTARGDTVVVRGTMTIPAPVGAGTTFDLLLSAAAVTGDCGCEPEPVCPGTTRTRPPLVRWSAASSLGLPGSDVKLGAEIPIVRVTRAANGTLSGVDYSQRRSATSLARPHVVSGTVRAGQLAWKQGTADLYATVDTDAAGFTTTPTYVASVGNDPPWPRTIMGPLVGIEAQSPTSFTVRLVFGAGPGFAVPLPALLVHARSVALSWTGVETSTGCPPTLGSLGTLSNPWSSP